MGNIKYELTPPKNLEADLQRLKQVLSPERRESVEGAFSAPEKLFWIVASTHEGEEALAIEAFKRARKLLPQLHLILAPRHPERFEAVAQLLRDADLTFDRRSETALENLSLARDLWLIDTLGELLLFYAFADITTVAGSFVPIGGHNILEPAYFSKPIIVGPFMDENRETLTDFQAHDAIIQVENSELAAAVVMLAKEKEARLRLGRNARRWMMENQGGSAIILEALA